jgi:hypothetical protein
MSSSHRSGQRIKETDLEAVSKTTYICPQCGKQRMRQVVGPCEFDDGEIIPNLERMHCFACGSDFFDPAAMDVIERFWESQKRKPARTGRQKKAGTAVYSSAA